MIVKVRSKVMLAARDFTNAIQLAPSQEIETQARLGRLKLFNTSEQEYEHSDQDCTWLMTHCEGVHLGEALYWIWNRQESVWNEPQEALVALTRAFELGYDKPEVFNLRAYAHYHMNNYGSALQDINQALECPEIKAKTKAGMLSLKANILVTLNKFREAHSYLIEARKLFGDGFRCSNTIASKLDLTIIWRYCLAYEFGALDKDDLETAKLVIQLLGSVMDMVIDINVEYPIDDPEIARVRVEEGPIQFSKSHPEIARTIRRLVGEEYWQMHNKGLMKKLSLEWQLKDD